jgi:hypothetical protein
VYYVKSFGQAITLLQKHIRSSRKHGMETDFEKKEGKQSYFILQPLKDNHRARQPIKEVDR